MFKRVFCLWRGLNVTWTLRQPWERCPRHKHMPLDRFLSLPCTEPGVSSAQVLEKHLNSPRWWHHSPAVSKILESTAIPCFRLARSAVSQTLLWCWGICQGILGYPLPQQGDIAMPVQIAVGGFVWQEELHGFWKDCVLRLIPFHQLWRQKIPSEGYPTLLKIKHVTTLSDRADIQWSYYVHLLFLEVDDPFGSLQTF